jgi:hypothetical protein
VPYTRCFLSLLLLLADWLLADEDKEGSAGDVFLYVQGILESFALDPFIRKLEWSKQQRMDVVQAAQAELRIPGANITFGLIVVCGRRPGG